MPGTIVIAKSLFAAKYEEQLLGSRKEFGFLRASVRKCAQSAGNQIARYGFCRRARRRLDEVERVLGVCDERC